MSERESERREKDSREMGEREEREKLSMEEGERGRGHIFEHNLSKRHTKTTEHVCTQVIN